MHKTILLSLSIVLWFSAAAQAIVYAVNRSFQTATLTGTVSIPAGNYVIQEQNPNPFTNVNLSLTVNAGSYNLVNALTDWIYNGGQFFINASPTTLTFSASGNGSGPADLVFSD